jgi:hypothetical protein
MLPGPVLDELIGKVKALDMDDVRRQIAEHEKGDRAEKDDGQGKEGADV